HPRVAFLEPTDRLVNSFLLLQLALLNARLQFPQVFLQPLLVALPNGPVLLFASLTQAEKVNLLPLLSTLDAHLGFLLIRIARRRHADHLFPVVALLELSEPRISLRLPARYQIVKSTRSNRGQIFLISHAAIHHHSGARFPAGALLQTIQHLSHRGTVLAVAVEDFMRFRKTVAVQHQAYEHLLAIGPLIPRVAALGLRVARGLALEVSRGQIVQVQSVVEMEQRLLAFGQLRFDALAVRI